MTIVMCSAFDKYHLFRGRYHDAMHHYLCYIAINFCDRKSVIFECGHRTYRKVKPNLHVIYSSLSHCYSNDFLLLLLHDIVLLVLQQSLFGDSYNEMHIKSNVTS